MLIKISCVYVSRYERESLKTVPYVLKKIIAIEYLMVEISIFNDVYFLEDCGQFIIPFSDSPKGQNIRWKNIHLKRK